MKIAELEPRAVFSVFSELCQIPHGSFHTREISDYLANFAKTRGFAFVQDSFGNVVIDKPASPGREQEPVMLLQGHMDMVAVKEDSCEKDLETEGLDLVTDGEYVWAKGTSLGADDGIALAYALAILEDTRISHPPLQMVFTVDEEVGMDGAIGLDPACLKGNKLLNIDSEEEGIFTVGCAGGTKLETVLSLDKCMQTGTTVQISLRGLLGGHSGTMIQLGRANANVLLGRILYSLSEELKASGKEDFTIIECAGGDKSNAIATWAEAMLLVPSADRTFLERWTKDYFAMLKREYAGKETAMELTLTIGEQEEALEAVNPFGTKRILQLLLSQPDGVQAYHAKLTNLVETSLNLGILRLEKGQDWHLKTVYEIRSNIESGRIWLKQRVCEIAKLLGAEPICRGEYPEWEYRMESPLRDQMVRVFEKMYGKKPEVLTIHAGLECGVLSKKIKNLDAVSFGPNILDIHTTKERLEVESTRRTWEYLLALLAERE